MSYSFIQRSRFPFQVLVETDRRFGALKTHFVAVCLRKKFPGQPTHADHWCLLVYHDFPSYCSSLTPLPARPWQLVRADRVVRASRPLIDNT